VKIIDVVRNQRRAQNFLMTLIRITGSQLHAARVLVGLFREEVAERAGLCRRSIRSWENSSHAIPGAMYSHLCRLIDVVAATTVTSCRRVRGAWSSAQDERPWN